MVTAINVINVYSIAALFLEVDRMAKTVQSGCGAHMVLNVAV